MRSEHKAIALLGTWLMIGAMMGIVLTELGSSSLDDWVFAALAGVFGLILVAVTAIITVATPTITEPRANQRADREPRGLGKAKNSDTALVDRLIATMSDAELAALRRRLGQDEAALSDDGEIISLEEAIRGKRR
jgi:hypothetical protein